MKYLSQIAIIMSISFVGELLNSIIPLPVPGSIYGLVIMFVLLVTGILKVDNVKKTGDFLLSMMPIMFVGPVVGLMNSYNSYKSIIIPVIVISMVTTVVTMIVTGLSAEKLIDLTSDIKERR